jgi:hypothetical protein
MNVKSCRQVAAGMGVSRVAAYRGQPHEGRARVWSVRVAALAVAALLVSACSTAATPGPISTTAVSAAAPTPVLVVPTPVATEAPVETISPSEPSGASGAAKLSGSISGIFGIQGDDCPTPEHPDGFLSGSGMIDSGEAILEVTVKPDSTVSFTLYQTPGDKSDAVAGTGPASLQVAGDGWATSLQAAPTPIGPVNLDVEWSCGG